MSTTTTVVGTPDPDDESGKVIKFRKPDTPAEPGTALEPADVVDAEIVDDSDDGRERAPVDPPGPAEDRSLEARMRSALEAKRQPVIVPWLRSRTEFTKTAKWAAGHLGHTTAYHAARSPLYALRLALRSPRGLLRAIAVTGTWAFDLEGTPLRHSAVLRDDADLYLKLAKERSERVRARVWLAVLATVVLTAGGLMVFAWGPWWAQWLAIGGGIGVLGWLGTPADKRIAGRAVVSTKVQKLTSEVVVRALSALGLAEVNKAVGKGGQGITSPRRSCGMVPAGAPRWICPLGSPSRTSWSAAPGSPPACAARWAVCGRNPHTTRTPAGWCCGSGTRTCPR